MSEHFHIGQQVVCIEARWQREHLDEKHVVKGAVYTIRAIEDTPWGAALQFEEILNVRRIYHDGFGEVSYFATRFRPLRAIDISVFTAMLAPVKEPA